MSFSDEDDAMLDKASRRGLHKAISYLQAADSSDRVSHERLSKLSCFMVMNMACAMRDVATTSPEHRRDYRDLVAEYMIMLMAMIATILETICENKSMAKIVDRASEDVSDQLTSMSKGDKT